ncbi:uncharacterized protein [Atheta coriaria]|uniref:uncharacterized protein isoform X2 n=1 Tax=Dalotia coriaria TaxID=877792 RepID=UPI0031F40ACF
MLWPSLILVLFISIRNSFAYIEYVEVSNCASCQMMLTCRHLSSVIAIFNATFQPYDDESSFFDDVHRFQLFPRLALNRRCSGVNHCSFVLTEDCPGAARWGSGNFTVKFACVSDRRIRRYCNDNITLPGPDVIGISEGLIRNPGYPNYYLGKEECRWRIRAPPLQQIKLTILDLSLIATNNDPDDCVDLFEVKEVDNSIFSSCNEQEPLRELITLSDSVDITLRASESLVARRGVLVHYAAVGCATPASPKDGYLVYRNDSTAVFTCSVGYVFADTLERNREIQCQGHRWQEKLPLANCIKLSSTLKDLFGKSSGGVNMTAKESFSDVLVPTIIIIMLFIINTIILFFIYQYKKRKTALYTEEELGTMPVGSLG